MDFNMNFEELMFEKLQKIFADVLEIDKDQVKQDSTIDNLSGWDSMKHLELILEIEKIFQVEFLPHEMILLNTVERIMTKISERKA